MDAHARWKSKRSLVVDSLPFDSLRSVAGQPGETTARLVFLDRSSMSVKTDSIPSG